MRKRDVAAVFGVAFLAVTVAASFFSTGYAPARDIPGSRGEGPTVSPPRIGEHVSSVRESVRVPTARGFTDGWLVRPSDGPTAAAIVWVHGAGQHGREDGLDIADMLAGRGIAVLIAEKDTRGYSFFRRDFDRLARDAALQLEWLRGGGLTDGPIGFLGVSEGGWVAPMAADRISGADLMVLVSAPVVTPLEQTTHLMAANLPSPLHRWGTLILSGGREFSDYLDTDIGPILSGSDRPVFAVIGSDDRAIPINQSVERLNESASGSTSVLFVAGSGHDIAAGGWVDSLAGWIVHDQPNLGILGDPPAHSIGAPRPFDRNLLLHPLIQLAATMLLTTIAVAARVVRVRPRFRQGPSYSR